MERFSCATATRLANEDPIATAYPAETYVLMECPLPWAAQAWETPQIPERLRTTIAEITAQYAPTAITFQDGRYYARLDAFSFNSVLPRSGDINLLKPIYRGSSLLPEAVQELERSLLLQYGWDWLNFKLNIQMRSIDSTQPESGFWVQIEWQNRMKFQFGIEHEVAFVRSLSSYVNRTALIASDPSLTKLTTKSSEVGRIEFKAFDSCGDFDRYGSLLTLLKGLLIDTQLPDRASPASTPKICPVWMERRSNFKTIPETSDCRRNRTSRRFCSGIISSIPLAVLQSKNLPVVRLRR